MQPRIIAHGGAWYWNDSLDDVKRQGMEAAVRIGQEILMQGGSALDAVEQTVISLENNPVFDAGTGGYLNREGVVQLDALIADGSKLDFGAVAGVSRIRNPIVVARQIMQQTPHNFFVGSGAEILAQAMGIALIDNDSLITREMQQFASSKQTDGHDTVGAVAIDQDGNVAVGTSTSGSPYKPAGRVGDSPIFGSGGYADNHSGAAGATGQGEHIMRLLLSKHTCDLLQKGCSAQEAAIQVIEFAEARIPNSMSGVIVVDRAGNLGVAHSTPKMALGWIDTAGRIRIAMRASSGLQSATE